MKAENSKSGTKRKRRQKSAEADWESIDHERLSKLVGAITNGGGAVRFGYSRDGGAYSIGIYGDGKPFTEFHPEDDGIGEWIEGLIDDYS